MGHSENVAKYFLFFFFQDLSSMQQVIFLFIAFLQGKLPSVSHLPNTVPSYVPYPSSFRIQLAF